MNYKLFALCLLVIAACTFVLRNCFGEQPANDNSPHTPTQPTDSVLIDQPEDNFLYGRLGDGTGMGAYEFITQYGDTLYLNKTSEYTGLDAIQLGDATINANDTFAVRLTDNDEAALVMVNMTQLRTQWRDDNQGFLLTPDSAVTNLNTNTTYRRWLLSNDQLVLTRSLRHEGGLSETNDTLRIVSLTADTLVMLNHYGDTVKYTH